jgi:hypothetical protein
MTVTWENINFFLIIAYSLLKEKKKRKSYCGVICRNKTHDNNNSKAGRGEIEVNY